MSKHDDKDGGDKSTDEFPVAALGASAGGLSALRTFFEAMPPTSGIAFVVVQHLAPDQESDLAAILQRFTKMEVCQVSESVTLRPNRVYVIAPNTSLSVKDRHLELGEPAADRRTHISIDHFFETLAEDLQEDAIGVILSGTRSDGARGLVKIKERGGLTFAQHPDEAEYPSMPQSAIETGRVDLILPTAEIARRLSSYSTGDYSEEAVGDEIDTADPEAVFREIISQIHKVTGHDFSNYKRSTLERRIHRRRQLYQLRDMAAYLKLLREDSDEVQTLFDEILIGVTEFFRDEEAFEALQKEVISKLLDDKDPDTPLRIWVPACSTGEEVYTLAMLLWEESERHQVMADFKIFATDLDARAIDRARKAIFSEASCQSLTEERKNRFMESLGRGYRVVKELRDRVLFAVHNVIRDPPFARQHLVSCRNLLIYLDEKAQRRVLEVLHYSLRPDGFLFLGSSEFIGSSKELFSAVDATHRIYRPKAVDRKHLPVNEFTSMVTRANRFEVDPAKPGQNPPRSVDLEKLHHQTLVERYSPASVLVNAEFEILHIVGDISPFLRLPAGRPTVDIMQAVQPDIRMKLRSALVNAFDQSSNAKTAPFDMERDGQLQSVQIFVQLTSQGPKGKSDHAIVSFEPRGETRPVPHEVNENVDAESSMQAVVERLEKESETTRRELEQTIENYETTTEELKTTNEELLTINEELQSTTEELETSKEELQSTNEELITVNEEVSHKVAELDDVNNDLKNLLSATEIGTIFLDKKLNLRRFNKPVQNYFNLIGADLGRPFEHITHRLDYDGLTEDARKVLDDLQPVEQVVSTRDNTWYIARVLPYRTIQNRIDGVVLTFFDITDRREVSQRLEESELLFRTVFEYATDAFFIFSLDGDGKPSNFLETNEGACQRLGFSELDLSRMDLYELVAPTSVDLDAYLHKLRETGRASAEMEFISRSGERTVEEMSARFIDVSGEGTVIAVSRDISERKEYEAALLGAKEESERLADLRASFLANMSHEIRTPLTSIIGVSQLLTKRDLSEEQMKMVQLIRTSGKRLHQTLDSVLDISRIEAGEMKPRFKEFDVVKQIVDDVDVLRPMAIDKGLTLEFHCPVSTWIFCTDSGFLNRIVYNLVENAIKFTREGMVEVYLEPGEDELKLTVSDTGIGVGEDFLPHLFDKFKQASVGISRSFEGSGLGLALVQNLIALTGGTISVESERGKGTTFSVVLPDERMDSEHVPFNE